MQTINGLYGIVKKHEISIPSNGGAAVARSIERKIKEHVSKGDIPEAFKKNIVSGILLEDKSLFCGAAACFDFAGSYANVLKLDEEEGILYSRVAIDYIHSDLENENERNKRVAYAFVKSAGAYSRIPELQEKSFMLLERAEDFASKIGLLRADSDYKKLVKQVFFKIRNFYSDEKANSLMKKFGLVPEQDIVNSLPPQPTSHIPYSP